MLIRMEHKHHRHPAKTTVERGHTGTGDERKLTESPKFRLVGQRDHEILTFAKKGVHRDVSSEKIVVYPLHGK